MYKLFIVDDEYNARNGLKKHFEWEKYGIEIAGEAEDGEEALDRIAAVKPDIVLTDVKMPRMDGIQLCIALREQYEKIKIIFFSGYDDIEYLKSALQLDAIDYILKPVKRNELYAAVEKVLQRLAEESKQKSLMNKMNIKLKQSMPLLREKFFMTLISHWSEGPESILKKMEFLDIGLKLQGRFCVFVISVDDQAVVFQNMSEKNKQLTSFAIINICEELIEKWNTGYAFESTYGEYVCILSLKEDAGREDIPLHLAQDIKSNILHYLELSVTIGVGGAVEELAELPQSYSAAFAAAKRKLVLGKNRIIEVDNSEHTGKVTYSFNDRTIEKMSTLLNAADENSLNALLEDIFRELASETSMDIEGCQKVCLQWMLLMDRVLAELDFNVQELHYGEALCWENIYRLETIQDMKSFLLRRLTFVCRFIAEKMKGKPRNIVEQVKNIIAGRYGENITVADIASAVYLTSNHISAVFKQETGETINEYLTGYRIEMAKELLENPKMKLYDICYAVGYSDPSYFTKIFKRYTGLSPMQYRNKKI